jgi:hypothetical protein
MTVESPNVIPPEALELTDESIHRMSPDMARDTLAAMQARYTAENPVDKNTRDGRLTMTPAEATAKLAEMDLAARPTDADGKPPFNPIVSSHELLARNVAEIFIDLENRGFPARGTPIGDELHDFMEGRKPVTPEIEKAVRAKHKQCIADREWGKRLMEGEQRASHEWHIMTAIIAAAETQRDDF